LPLVGTISDDHGLGGAAVRLRVAGGGETMLPVARVRTGDAVVAERLDRLLLLLTPDEAETVLSGLEHLNQAMERMLAERFGPPSSEEPRRTPQPDSAT
jgi:hypothetical protein